MAGRIRCHRACEPADLGAAPVETDAGAPALLPGPRPLVERWGRLRQLLDDRGDDLLDAAPDLAVVGAARDDGHPAGAGALPALTRLGLEWLESERY
jgi:hypothetical protein